ncbi:MAG: HPr family phosphocarrier protein [Schaedlerella sp.]|nr:HPr family phosphocarrier protein [Lachnospiraceae bacterium]MDY4202560.1 HPr family phosphocarrier protein [Schaedlerella sp.]
MSTIKIMFKNPEEIVSFVNTVERYDIPIQMKSDEFIVDAKSILGIMYLGLNNIIEVEVCTEDCEQLKKEILRYRAA